MTAHQCIELSEEWGVEGPISLFEHLQGFGRVRRRWRRECSCQTSSAMLPHSTGRRKGWRRHRSG